MLSSCCWCLILVAMVAGAPVQEEKVKDAKTAEVQNQEKELKSLLHLADEQEKHKDVSVHEEHVQHLHDVNGHVTKEEETRKTVTDVKTGKLLSDVKQEVKSEEVAVAGASPKVEVKTEVDLPAEGVHETLVQLEDGAGVAAGVDKEDEVEEFSPEVVADYLYQTGDFDRFYTTLAQLVNNSVMTEAEAVSFAELVAQSYRQRVEEYENNILVQRRAQSQPLPDLYSMTLDAREPYPLGLENDDRYLLSLDNSDSYGVAPQELPTETEVDANAYDILGELLREAFVGGDERAQAIVQELYNQAENDDDAGAELRSMLVELAATQNPGLQNPGDWEPYNIMGPNAQSDADKNVAANTQLPVKENDKSQEQGEAHAEAKPSTGQVSASEAAAKPGESRPAANAEPKSEAEAKEAKDDKTVQKRAPETV